MDISGQGLMWYARPQLFFNCTVCPTGQRARKHRHMELSLVFFSTFEPINITPHSVMQRNGVPMLYDTASGSNEPSLYVCPVSNVLALREGPAKKGLCGCSWGQEAGADFGKQAAGGSDLEEALGAAWGWFLWAPAQPTGRAGSGIKMMGLYSLLYNMPCMLYNSYRTCYIACYITYILSVGYWLVFT